MCQDVESGRGEKEEQTRSMGGNGDNKMIDTSISNFKGISTSFLVANVESISISFIVSHTGVP